MTRPLLLWVAVLGAPLAWVAQLTLGYGLEEFACSHGTATRRFLGLGVEPSLIGLTVAAAIVAVSGGAAGLAAHRSLSRERDGDPRGHGGFLAFAGLLASLLFLVLIVLGGAQLLSLDPCVPG